MSENILNTDLSDVSLDFPVLPRGEYTLTVKDIQRTTTQKGAAMLKITLVTTAPAVSTTGEPLQPGFVVYDQIVVEPTGNLTEAQIKRSLKQFRKAVTGQEGGAFEPIDQYIGRAVRAVVRVEPAQDGYQERNSIARYLA